MPQPVDGPAPPGAAPAARPAVDPSDEEGPGRGTPRTCGAADAAPIAVPDDPRVCRRAFLHAAAGRAAAGVGLAAGGVAGLAAVDVYAAPHEGPLHTEQLGAAGPRVAFLPGLGATTRYWRPVAARVAAGARCTLVDLLGFGRSPKPPATYSVARHVAALHAALGALGPLTLVGHSLGARLAVAYAATHPAHVERLVLVGLPYFPGAAAARAHVAAHGAGGWLWAHPATFALACLLGRRLAGWALPLAAGDLPREVVDDLRRMTWRSSSSTAQEVLYRYDPAADLARVPRRTAVVCLHGGRDATAPLGGLRALCARRPGCEVRVLADADHHLPVRAAPWVGAELRRALG